MKFLKSAILPVFLSLLNLSITGQNLSTGPVRPLSVNQQDFVNLRFGMFIHFNIPTFMDDDWADPEASPEIFNPARLNCDQWAKAAKSAGMSYGCLTTKHHSGFCIWNPKTTGYSVMNSPLRRDVVREYADAFRDNGLKVMLYYSILDTHHKLRPGFINRGHIDMVKAQLTELLTNYGEITALIIDGWDAPWSRISYDEIPFEDIYWLVKSIQPNCLLMDLNAAKYPAEALFYTDIKSYEQGAGQHVSKESNRLPALSCLPLNRAWFWKPTFPSEPVKDPEVLVKEDIIPFNKVFCNFILNVAPNRDGLIDDNAIEALRDVGKLWKNEGPLPALPLFDAPVISSNIAKHRPAESSWSSDMDIMDFANDDNFKTSWISNPAVKEPWWQVSFDREQPFNLITIVEGKSNIRKYRIEYREQGTWKPLLTGEDPGRVKIHRFNRVSGDQVRIRIDESSNPPSIAELGVYNERKQISMQKVTTFLMFTGKAEEAINFYTSLFEDSGILSIERYLGNDGGKAGTVRHALFKLKGQEFMCIDSPVEHAFTFTPAISLWINCTSDQEIDRLFEKLSEGGQVFMPLGTYPFSERFAWIANRYGVSWQLSKE